jgi:uncharacterized Ntn-hydrolase superfamily protein
VGAVLTQHRTDPRLGPRGLDLLQSGCEADGAVRALVASTAHSAWRQLAVVDSAGRTAAFSGSGVHPFRAEEFGDGCVVVGNMLAGEHVGSAMRRVFEESADEPLAERLLRSLESGEAAGGEQMPVRSAALVVVGDQLFPLVDLRVDLSDRPLADLRRTWAAYRPLVGEFVMRAIDPDNAGVGR